MSRINLILILLCLSTFSFSQAPVGLRHASSSEFKVDFYVNTTPKKIKYKDTLSYYWFKAQEIHISQGASSGYPLHGDYSKFYTNGQLAEKGLFKKGLKNGLWKSWYASGKIKSVYNYKNGLLVGDFVLFDEKGNTIEQGKFKKGIKEIQEEEKEKEKVEEVDEKEKKSWIDLFKRKKNNEEGKVAGENIDEKKQEKELEKRRRKKEREDKKAEKNKN